MAFAPVFDGKCCIIADQSGSGKTLAYLLTVIQRLRQEELQGLHKYSSRSPQVVIIVPTAELASQHCLDEVDVLFGDQEFEVALQNLISSSPITTQYLFVTATLPVDVYNKLVEVFPDCEVIMGPGMHRISPGLEEILVDCSGDPESDKTPETAFLNKKSALLQLVEKNPVSKTIVFCNKIETCRKVENILRRLDRRGTRIQVLPFHAALEQESQLANMKEFTTLLSKEENLFLVCTYRASHGIDFAGVDHVILFEFPRDPSEYLRRVGRTARGAGGKGKAFIFVVGKQV